MSKMVFDRIEYFDTSFADLDCSGQEIRGLVFEECDFKNCNFRDARLLGCRFIECNFSNCNLNNIGINNSSFSSVEFRESTLQGVDLSVAKWPNIKLFSPIHFYDCNISNTSFFGISCSEINLQRCKAHSVDFREADLSLGCLIGTDFYGSLFGETKLLAADLTEAINYNIDMELNDIKDAVFSFPDVINLLKSVKIKIKDLPWE